MQNKLIRLTVQYQNMMKYDAVTLSVQRPGISPVPQQQFWSEWKHIEVCCSPITGVPAGGTAGEKMVQQTRLVVSQLFFWYG